MAKIEAFPIPPSQNGITREAAIDEVLVPENTSELIINMNCDRIGAMVLRPGITILGSVISAGVSVLGMANYRNNAGTMYRALAMVGTQVYAWAGATWTSVRSGLTGGSKARFTNFIDLTYMVNGNANEDVSTYDGTTFGTSNVADLPKGDYIENYRSRIWVADSSEDKVYYSNVVEPDNTLTGGTEFIQVSPQDGEKITGLKRHSRALLVFKQNHIYRIFSPNSADPDPAIFRGTYSQESIIEGKDGISYHHSSGFYNFRDGGEQEEISRPIVDFVEAIPRTAYENVVGWVDDNHKYWSVGDITLKGVTFKNIVFRWTISTQIWTIYSYNKKITSAVVYDSGTNLVNLVGNTDGKVLTFDSGNSDDGDPIYFEIITHYMYFTTVKSMSKGLSEIAVLHENAYGVAKMEYQIDGQGENEWQPMSQIKKNTYETMNLKASRFNKIRFRLSGNSKGMPFIYRGIEILSLITDGVIDR